MPTSPRKLPLPDPSPRKTARKISGSAGRRVVRSIPELLRRIVSGALPLGAAVALHVGCECPTSTSEDAWVLRVQGQALSTAQTLANADGSIALTNCQTVCRTSGESTRVDGDYGYGNAQYTACSFSTTPPVLSDGPDVTSADDSTGTDAGTGSDAGGDASGDTGSDSSGDTSGPVGYVLCEAVVTSSCDGVGRRVAGDRLGPASTLDHPIARYFSEAAAIETTAAHAFSALASDLEGHGAPRELVDRARHAAVQERRHAALIQQLVARYDGAPRAAALSAQTGRSLVAIAIENAAEGCVGETWGAVVAAWQAEWADDEVIRETLAQIAPEEAEHAQWSWDLHHWIWSRVDEDDKARIAAALDEAVVALRKRIAMRRDPLLHQRAGLPTPETSAALFDELMSTLWSAA